MDNRVGVNHAATGKEASSEVDPDVNRQVVDTVREGFAVNPINSVLHWSIVSLSLVHNVRGKGMAAGQPPLTDGLGAGLKPPYGKCECIATFLDLVDKRTDRFCINGGGDINREQVELWKPFDPASEGRKLTLGTAEVKFFGVHYPNQRVPGWLDNLELEDASTGRVMFSSEFVSKGETSYEERCILQYIQIA